MSPQVQPENKPICSSPHEQVTEMTVSTKPESFMPAIGPSAAFWVHTKDRVIQLQDQFNTIVIHTKSCFMKKAESKIFVSSFQMALIHLQVHNQGPPEYFLKTEERDCIKKTEDVEEILGILKPYWNYFDYELLEHIVKEFGTSKLQQKVKEYIEELERFEKTKSIQLIFNIPSLHKRNIPDHFVKMVIHLRWNAAECMFYKVHELKNKMADHMNLKRYALYLMEVKPGSVVIVLAIPPSAKGLFEGSSSTSGSMGGCSDYRERAFVPQWVMS